MESKTSQAPGKNQDLQEVDPFANLKQKNTVFVSYDLEAYFDLDILTYFNNAFEAYTQEAGRVSTKIRKEDRLNLVVPYYEMVKQDIGIDYNAMCFFSNEVNFTYLVNYCIPELTYIVEGIPSEDHRSDRLTEGFINLIVYKPESFLYYTERLFHIIESDLLDEHLFYKIFTDNFNNLEEFEYQYDTNKQFAYDIDFLTPIMELIDFNYIRTVFLRLINFYMLINIPLKDHGNFIHQMIYNFCKILAAENNIFKSEDNPF